MRLPVSERVGRDKVIASRRPLPPWGAFRGKAV